MGEPEIRDSNTSLRSSFDSVLSEYGGKSHLPAVFLTSFFVCVLVLILFLEIRSRHQQTLDNTETVLISQTAFAGSKVDNAFSTAITEVDTLAQKISRAITVPIDLDRYYSPLQKRAPWMTGLVLVAPNVNASSYAGMPPSGLSDDWMAALPKDLVSASVWQPASDGTQETPLAVISPIAAAPAVLIAWIDTQAMLTDAISGPVLLNADQLVLLDQQAGYVSAIVNEGVRLHVPSELSDWARRPRAAASDPLYSYPLNGDDRVLAYAPLTAAPFAVTLSLPVASALGPWYGALPTYLLLMFVPAAVGITCAYFFIRDSNRKDQLTRSLLTSKQRYENAITAAKCGVWDWDIDAKHVLWSPAMLRLLDDPDGKASRSFEEVGSLIHPADKSSFDSLVADMEAASSDYDLTLRLKKVTGNWLWVRLKGHSIRHEDLWAKQYLGVAIDVTAERSAREQLVATEQRLRETVESLSESFLLSDASGSTILSNKCFRELSALLAPEDRDLLTATPHGLVAGDREVRLQDGRWFQISHQRASDGCTVQVGTDISRLKKQEHMLKDSQAVLLASVDHIKKSRAQLKQQTRELADLADRYAIEKKRAQESSRSKSEFLANMSHELRTPLNAIIGFSEMMMSEIYGSLGDDKYRVYASDIFESGQHLLAMIEDILEMSRIDTGRLELVRAHVNLEEILREVLQVVEIRAREASIRITTDLGQLPSVFVDSQAMRQVLLQLLSNAVKFTPEHGAIHVSGAFTEGSVSVTVSDTGIGIPKERLGAIGQPFEVVEKQDVKTRDGKGLGLALARSLIELHGGTLTIDSDEGSGTTVRFEIPIEQKLKPRHVVHADDPKAEDDADEIIEESRKVASGH